jgi:hypothetical protein
MRCGTNLLLNTTSPNYSNVLITSDMKEMSVSQDSRGGIDTNITPGT